VRVVYLTAGAAGMYCGSCMRDNTLVAALRARGREAMLVPLYTPIRTDEDDVSEPQVFYGGINVYLQQKSALFRHTPWLLDRLLDSPALLRKVTSGAGQGSFADLAAMTISMLKGEHGAQRKELSKLIRWLAEVRPDVVNLPNAMLVGAARAIKETLGTPVFCTLTGEDIFIDKLPEPHRGEVLDLIRERGREVSGFVAVSSYYAEYSRDQFGIPADRLHVIPLGVRVEAPADPTEPPAGPFTIGYLARICPAKGLHILCQALEILWRSGRSCRLRIAGYCGASDRAYLEGIRGHLAGEKLDHAVDYVGEVDRPGKLGFLRSLHVLSVPTVYREAKGIYVLEALANGVPVIQPRHGAFPELVEATGGGLLFEPGDPGALAGAIAGLMDDPALRRELGRRGRSAVIESFTAELMAERTWALYKQELEKAGTGAVRPPNAT
jgi:glycosyltransferase involved in cell wall biosynthesis